MTGTEGATTQHAQSAQQKPPVAVLIIGGGPVGLSLGMDLASRGVETLILEQRAAMEPPEPRPLQPCIRPHHGGVSPSRGCGSGTRRRSTG